MYYEDEYPQLNLINHNFENGSALHIAAEHDNRKLMLYLLSHGLSVCPPYVRYIDHLIVHQKSRCIHFRVLCH